MTKPNPFTALLHNAMAKRGIGQREAASIVGCSQPCLNRWMKGLHIPKVAHLKGLSRLTGLKIPALVRLYGDRP